jgi:LacI family transcriptional regulator
MGKSINDIAQKLQVSKTTVSLVLNSKGDKNNISKTTQKKILELAEKWNYKPNVLARSLSTGKSLTIGLIVPDISNQFFSKLCRHIEDALEKKGYKLMISSSDEDIEKETGLIETMVDRKMDGIILAAASTDNPIIRKLSENHYPLVLIDRKVPGLPLPYAGTDNFEGAYHLTKKLLDEGYLNQALFCLTPHISPIKERIQGFETAFSDEKDENKTFAIKEVDFYDVKASMKKEFEMLFEAKPETNAIFFATNKLAINGLWVLNKHFPDYYQKCRFVSFDDIELFDFFKPGISSAAQNVTRISEKAVEMLFYRIEKHKIPEQPAFEFAPKIIFRK